MAWVNSDGLIVKFDKELGAVSNAGEYHTQGANRVSEFVIDYKDMLTATPTTLGDLAGSPWYGSLGATLPQGARIEEIEVVVETAFTSSGTIGSATFVLGLKDLDRSTEEDNDGFTAAAATGTVLGLATVGTKTVIRKGSTGAGALVGANTPDAGYLCVSNSAHASHPYTAGRAVVRIYWRPDNA